MNYLEGLLKLFKRYIIRPITLTLGVGLLILTSCLVYVGFGLALILLGIACEETDDADK
jgi:hypothetical protein